MATIRGRPYYNITCALKLMELQFDSLSPQEAAGGFDVVVLATPNGATAPSLHTTSSPSTAPSNVSPAMTSAKAPEISSPVREYSRTTPSSVPPSPGWG